KGLAIGAGVYAASRKAIGIDNLYFTPSFMSVDGKISYEIGSWTFAVIGKNLLDAEYWQPYFYFDGRVAPSEPRTVFGSVSYKF
ncbi:MAG TPA: TonB-dependent receptor, partial [Hyphomicrobiaceae bacterium]|nr:TonB-dependent receptor [Hyphomicrobiaceae bacterium]